MKRKQEDKPEIIEENPEIKFKQEYPHLTERYNRLKRGARIGKDHNLIVAYFRTLKLI